jgi:predicted nucleotidyltransferase
MRIAPAMLQSYPGPDRQLRYPVFLSLCISHDAMCRGNRVSLAEAYLYFIVFASISQLIHQRPQSRSQSRLLKKRPEVLLSFLFESFARNRIHFSSDIDTGILFKTVPEMEALNDVTEGLSSILNGEVDLSVLNHASPVLKMQILKNGILLFYEREAAFREESISSPLRIV